MLLIFCSGLGPVVLLPPTTHLPASMRHDDLEIQYCATGGTHGHGTRRLRWDVGFVAGVGAWQTTMETEMC